MDRKCLERWSKSAINLKILYNAAFITTILLEIDYFNI